MQHIKSLRDYLGLILQANLSPSLNNTPFTVFQIAWFYFQLAHYLLHQQREQFLSVIHGLGEYLILIPVIESQTVMICIGVFLVIFNLAPYLIALYRQKSRFNRNVDNISKGMLQPLTLFINYYFLYFTWFLYIPQIEFVVENITSANGLLVFLASLLLPISVISAALSNSYFINFEFNEQNLKKHFSYTNVLSYYIIIAMVVVQNTEIEIRMINGLFIGMQFYEAIIFLPYGFSLYGQIFQSIFSLYALLYVITCIQAMGVSQYSVVVLFGIFAPVMQALLKMVQERRRVANYQNISSQSQYYELLYIEDFFELSKRAYGDAQSEIEVIVMFQVHREHCMSVLCQCKKIDFKKIKKLEYIVNLIQCLFKKSFANNINNISKKIGQFEIVSLKFLTFINKFKNNGPKTYQELKILFQRKRSYSYYFIQMCLLLQYKLQAQIKKDEDYNINTDSKNRASNVKLQASRNDKGIVQSLYLMEQVKTHFLPLIQEVCVLKAAFWSDYAHGKITSYKNVEAKCRELYILKEKVHHEYYKYRSGFYVNNKTYNVQFLKFTGLMHLILYNDTISYTQIEQQCREIIEFERGMTTYEITNISLLQGNAVSIKVCVGLGPNIGKIQNRVITKLIPKFFGFDVLLNPVQAFMDYTGANVNMLLPDWISPIHDEMMQNYIRRGHTARIGKYFNTFIKLYDKTLARVQVYLSNNFNPKLENDFAMIGCLRRLDEQQQVELQLQRQLPKTQSYPLRDLVFKGEQHMLFDIHGKILGVTTGFFEMIRNLQRQQSYQSLRKDSSVASSMDLDQEYKVQWSNKELCIEDFYSDVLSWMLFPTLSKQIEQTGMEFLMNGQRPPKNRYGKLVDLEQSNTILAHQHCIIYIPEDLNLFVAEYSRIIEKIMEDEKIQTMHHVPHSQGSMSKLDQEEPVKKESFVTIFNERLCQTFFGNLFRVKFSASPTDSRPRSQVFNEKTSIDEEEDEFTSKYADKYTHYSKGFTIQTFHSIPIMYSVHFEEYHYKKNEVLNKVQMFVIEMLINEQQLHFVEKENKKKIRDTIKSTFLVSASAYKNNLKHSSDMSVEQSVSENKSSIIQLYDFVTNTNVHIYEPPSIIRRSPRAVALDQMRISVRERPSLKELEKAARNSAKKLSYKQKSDEQLSLPQRQIALSVVRRIKEKKLQQDFFGAEHVSNGASHEQALQKNEDKYYEESLLQIEAPYRAVKEKIINYEYPRYYQVQVCMQVFILAILAIYIVLVSLSVWGSHNYSSCTNNIQWALNLQNSYSQVSQSLLLKHFLLNFSNTQYTKYLDANIHFYAQQFLNNISENEIAKLDFQTSLIEVNGIQRNQSLTTALQFLSAYFYEIESHVINYTGNLAYLGMSLLWHNQNTINGWPQIIYDQCYYQKMESERTTQNILIVINVVIFVAVLVVQSSHLPLTTKCLKYQKNIYKFLMNYSMVVQEIQTFETLQHTLEMTIYEWMAIDFIRIGRILDVDKRKDEQVLSTSRDQTEIRLIQKEISQKKMIKKLHKSSVQQIKYFVILLFEITTVLFYFTCIFVVVFILSSQIQQMATTLFQFELFYGQLISLLTNQDLLAYSTVYKIPFVISQTQYLNLTNMLSNVNTDFYLEFDTNLLDYIVNQNINTQLQVMNQNNICTYFDCTNNLVIQFDPQQLPKFTQGLKFLLAEVQKIISQYPEFFYQQNNSNASLLSYFTSPDHVSYIMYSQMILGGYDKVSDLGFEQLSSAALKYRTSLLIFIITVGFFAVMMQIVLGLLLLNMQKDSINICINSLLFLSPRRYLDKNIQLLLRQL